MAYEGPHPIPVSSGGTGANTLTGVLTGNGTSAITANTISQFNVVVAGASNAVTSVGPGTAGQILQSAGNASNPAYSTATYPSTATSTGTILRADGTNWSATTTTYPNTNAINTILYASSDNVMSALATANNAVLATNGSGVPSITATPTVTSIKFGTGSALSTYVASTSWTPAIAFGGSSTGVTYASAAGEYTQIGNIVFLTGIITLSSKGSQTGAVTVTGLPITVSGTATYHAVNESVAITLTAGYNALYLAFNTSSTTANLNEMTLAGGTSSAVQNVTNTMFANTSEIRFSGFYFTS